MNIDSLQKSLMMININGNKDCSEYADDIKNSLENRGKIVTFISRNSTFTALDNNKYYYHTVLSLKDNGSNYIIDVFSNNKVFLLNDYLFLLRKLNPNIDLFCIKGYASISMSGIPSFNSSNLLFKLN